MNAPDIAATPALAAAESLNERTRLTREPLPASRKVYVEGSLRTSSWEQEGQKRFRTEVVAREMQMLDGRAGGGGESSGGGGGYSRSSGYDQPARSAAPARGAAPAAAPAPADHGGFDDDDIPF